MSMQCGVSTGWMNGSNLIYMHLIKGVLLKLSLNISSLRPNLLSKQMLWTSHVYISIVGNIRYCLSAEPHYISAISETLTGFCKQTLPPNSQPIITLCNLFSLCLLLPAREMRCFRASIMVPCAHGGVLSHLEIHISTSFNLQCGSLSHIIYYRSEHYPRLLKTG